MISKTSIETVSGNYVDLADPQECTIDIHDIAWGLSRQARFAGHTITDIPYSVAQHSVFVCEIVESILTEGTHIRELFIKDDILDWINLHEFTVDPGRRGWTIWLGLFHDASEAYLVDLPSPVKRMEGIAEAYGAAESKLMSVILNKFGYWLKTWSGTDKIAHDIVHWADLYARAIEAHHFMTSRGKHWGLTQPGIRELHSFRQPIPALSAYDEFIQKVEQVTPQVIQPGD